MLSAGITNIATQARTHTHTPEQAHDASNPMPLSLSHSHTLFPLSLPPSLSPVFTHAHTSQTHGGAQGSEQDVSFIWGIDPKERINSLHPSTLPRTLSPFPALVFLSLSSPHFWSPIPIFFFTHTIPPFPQFIGGLKKERWGGDCLSTERIILIFIWTLNVWISQTEVAAVSLYCLWDSFVFIVFWEILFGGWGQKTIRLLLSGSLCQKVSVFAVSVMQFVAK